MSGLSRRFPHWHMQPCDIVDSGECTHCGKQMQRIILPTAAKLELASEIEHVIQQRSGFARVKCRLERGKRRTDGELPALPSVSGGERAVRHLHRRSEHRALQAELRGRDVQLPADRHDRLVSPAGRLQSADRAARASFRPAHDRSPRSTRRLLLL